MTFSVPMMSISEVCESVAKEVGSGGQGVSSGTGGPRRRYHGGSDLEMAYPIIFERIPTYEQASETSEDAQTAAHHLEVAAGGLHSTQVGSRGCVHDRA